MKARGEAADEKVGTGIPFTSDALIAITEEARLLGEHTALLGVLFSARVVPLDSVFAGGDVERAR